MLEFRQKFIDDASDLLSEMEQTLLHLEKSPNDSKLIEDVFRTMHTLKGTAGMYGFDEIGTFTHRMENIYDLIRNGRISVTKDVLNLTFRSVDFLNKALNANETENLTANYQYFYDQINKIVAAVDENLFDGYQREIENIEDQIEKEQSWFITIKPDNDLRKRGIKMHVIFDEIAESGQNHIFNRNQQQKGASSKFCEIFLYTQLSKADIEDILMFVQDISEIHLLGEENIFNRGNFNEKLQEYGTLSSINIDELKKYVTTESEEDEKITILPESKKQENIKVPAERLDEQMTLLSELVTAKAELELIIQQNGYKGIIKSVEKIDKITHLFRRNIFKIRLIPLEALQLRFDRLIRDLSDKLHKKVDFITEGMHTELDKTIIDSLESPLMHLIRNSLDHGIQTPDIRKMRGKSEKAQIKLVAVQVGAYVQITVSDDGDGIDSEQIREKAIQKGLISKKDKLSESQIYKLIFMPGFSTARNLTEVSGRGVGMDVVRQTIHSLRGTIDIKSVRGEGTFFTIKLPLTLSIIDTMLVRSGLMFYSIPISAIDKCTEIQQIDLKKRNNKQLVINEQLMPYLIIKDRLKINNIQNEKQNEALETDKSKVIVVQHDKQKTALIVDEIIGEHQAVLKPVGDYFKNVQAISGASQLADGHIAFVLDIARLIDPQTNTQSA